MFNLLGLIPTAFAQTVDDRQINLTPKNTEFVALSTTSLGDIISTLITIVMIIAGLIFLVMLIIGGVRWIVSGGDKAQTEAARGQITAALIGLVIVFSAYAIATLVGSVFGISIIDFTLPSITGAAVTK